MKRSKLCDKGTLFCCVKKMAENGILLDGLSFDKNGSVVTANIMENDNSVDGNGVAGDNTPNHDANGTDGPSNFDANKPGDSSNSVGTVIVFNEDVISNLQLQFEKVAAEMGFDENGAQTYESSSFTSQKKRKRGKKLDRRGNVEVLNPVEDGVDNGDNCRDNNKSLKRVRFAVKNNLLWGPHSPLPPQSLKTVVSSHRWQTLCFKDSIQVEAYIKHLQLLQCVFKSSRACVLVWQTPLRPLIILLCRSMNPRTLGSD